MGEPITPQEPSHLPTLINNEEEAGKILHLDKIKINNPIDWAKENLPIIPLFNEKQGIIQENFLWLLLSKQGGLGRDRLRQVDLFFDEPVVQEGVRVVHDKIVGNNPNGVWYTNTMLYPLVKKLLISERLAYLDIFKEWKDDWFKGVDPEKFRMAMRCFFKVAGLWSSGLSNVVGDLGDKPLDENEANFLADVFKEVVRDSNDAEKIEIANKKNRDFNQKVQSSDINFGPKDLFHTTNIETLPSIGENGLLSKECQSLTNDMYAEDTFAVSAWTFIQGVPTFIDLCSNLKKGGDTTKEIKKRIHIGIINPQLNEDRVLYPPESLWESQRENPTTKIAARYISGYPGSQSDFKKKAPAFILIGAPSTQITFCVLDESLKTEYVEKAKKIPFYIPGYSYEGKLLFTPEEYDAVRGSKAA